MIPAHVSIKGGILPDAPGVYLYFDRDGRLLYVGKATSLRRRVGSYFVKVHDGRIAQMVSQIARIDYLETPTVIEALVLEANEIKARRPKFNILQRDDKTFLYLAISNEPFPRPLLIRGHELRQMGVDPFAEVSPATAGRHMRVRAKFLRVFGPYTSGRSLKIALELVRESIPWSTCLPPEATGRTRRCFDAQIGKCPGVCAGTISRIEYRRIMRQLILFFEGKKARLLRELKRDMERASCHLRFEEAAVLRRRLFALEHIRDVALISREDYKLPLTKGDGEAINLLGRIEGYEISNISGTSAVGSMVVFEDGKPAKNLYRRFKIRAVEGANDVGMLEEVMSRRLARAKRSGLWSLPELMVIDGGESQIHRVQAVLDEMGVCVPIVGIAKGFDRKQDRLVYDREDIELEHVVHRGKELFQRVRDEAHRFAIRYHRVVRGRAFKKRISPPARLGVLRS